MVIKSNKLGFFFMLLVSVLTVSLFVTFIPLISWLGIFLFIWVFYEFFFELGTGIPIKRLMVLIAVIQWVIAPILSYHFFTNAVDFYMQIPEQVYMDFVVPSIVIFYLALCGNVNAKNNISNVHDLLEKTPKDDIYVKRGKLLFFLGFLGVLLQGFAPQSLKFAFFLLSKLIFVGSFYLFAARVKFRYVWLFIAFLPTIIGAQGSAIFHDMFLWGGYLFMVYAFIQKIGFLQKISFILFGIFVILFVQFFKGDYRKEIKVERGESGTQAIFEVTEQKLADEGITDDYYQSVVDRLNQGWIIARIMYVVPQFEPYADGETIKEGLFSALVPRFLVPDKVESGGAFFERFTKLELEENTSMNLGLIGEAYANYGSFGAMIFLMIIGFILKLAFNWINKYSFKRFEIILWLPFLFLYVVKAEDDFSTMINQLTKSALVCVVGFYFMAMVYPENRKKKLDEVK